MFEDMITSVINDKEYVIGPGYFYLMPPGVYHSHKTNINKGHVGFALRWDLIRKANNLSNSGQDVFYQLEDTFETLSMATSHPILDNGILEKKMIELLEGANYGSHIIETFDCRVINS